MKIDHLEQTLLEQYRAGDSLAFAKIFLMYRSDLILFAFSILRNTHYAEEVVQDVFLKLWEEREGIKISSSLRSFLLRSVQNKCIDWLRHQKTVMKYGRDHQVVSSMQKNEPESILIKNELEARIEKAIKAMPAEVAFTFSLSRFEGLKYHEIAQKLKVSQRTVEDRISKALQILRRFLKDYLLAAC